MWRSLKLSGCHLYYLAVTSTIWLHLHYLSYVLPGCHLKYLTVTYTLRPSLVLYGCHVHYLTSLTLSVTYALRPSLKLSDCHLHSLVVTSTIWLSVTPWRSHTLSNTNSVICTMFLSVTLAGCHHHSVTVYTPPVLGNRGIWTSRVRIPASSNQWL